MRDARRLGIVVCACVAMLVSGASRAEAGRGGTGCKSDKGVDVPMSFNIGVESAGRVRLSAYGGSDRSGGVNPAYSGAWKVYSASGTLISSFSSGMLVEESPNMLRETDLEGLVPGATYTIELTSQDLCAMRKSVRQSVTMPEISPETNAPEVSAPALTLIGGWGFSTTALTFSSSDDTGLRHVSVKINGVKIQEYSYSNGTGVRWWCENYPDDNVQSSLEGPNYYVTYPTSYRGLTAVVEIEATDLNGNMSVSSAVLGL